MNVRKIDVNEFQKRKFERSFISVYVVIKPIVVETDDGIEPKNLCVFYGFTALGARKIIAIYFEDTKDNRFWLNIFEDLKSRNLKNIMFLVTPKNRNIERCAKIVYNNIEVVRSPEDIMNSIDIFFPTKTSRALEIQLKNLLLAENIEICKEKIELFKQEYLHNKLVLTVFEKQEEDILKLGELIKKYREQNSQTSKKVKYNSIKDNELGKEIKSLTKRIKSYLFNDENRKDDFLYYDFGEYNKESREVMKEFCRKNKITKFKIIL